MDVSFPYVYGYEFVRYLYDRGNWARVNRAYADLPDSTEQILHPQKYIDGETPDEMISPALGDVLPPDWRELDRDVLGEWTTYLILGYGADLAAQQSDDVAANAAAGWGGDTYSAYTSGASEEIVLAAQWSWDSQADARQFSQAMQDYLDQRFRGNKIIRSSGDCWQASGQTTCLFSAASRTLWLIVPDESWVENILPLFSGF